jgi:hypothetical protein
MAWNQGIMREVYHLFIFGTSRMVDSQGWYYLRRVGLSLKIERKSRTESPISDVTHFDPGTFGIMGLYSRF